MKRKQMKSGIKYCSARDKMTLLRYLREKSKINLERNTFIEATAISRISWTNLLWSICAAINCTLRPPIFSTVSTLSGAASVSKFSRLRKTSCLLVMDPVISALTSSGLKNTLKHNALKNGVGSLFSEMKRSLNLKKEKLI